MKKEKKNTFFFTKVISSSTVGITKVNEEEIQKITLFQSF